MWDGTLLEIRLARSCVAVVDGRITGIKCTSKGSAHLHKHLVSGFLCLLHTLLGHAFTLRRVYFCLNVSTGIRLKPLAKPSKILSIYTSKGDYSTAVVRALISFKWQAIMMFRPMCSPC